MMWREERRTLWFLITSAVYRDGLAAVFTFAGVIASGIFGFSDTQVVIFAIAANLTAGLGAVFRGRLDDRLGPKTVIVGSLTALILVGSLITALPGQAIFWAGGLILAVFIGPAQSASRTFLARIVSAQHEAQASGSTPPPGARSASSARRPSAGSSPCSALSGPAWPASGWCSWRAYWPSCQSTPRSEASPAVA